MRRERSLRFVPSPGRVASRTSRPASFSGHPVSHHKDLPRDCVVPDYKRALDLLCIFLSLPIVLPVILLIGLWIRLVSKGPALYRQNRIGCRGECFTLYKFRTMKSNSDTSSHQSHVKRLVESDSPMTKLDRLDDPRLIPGGRFLRTIGFDELPQLLNVYRGEMSLVGPRPCLPEEYEFFDLPHRQRFNVLPGLTGYWQVNGKNRTTFKQMSAMDSHYSRKANLWLDLAIMARTPWALLQEMRDCLASKIQIHAKNSRHVVDSPLGYRTQRIGD